MNNIVCMALYCYDIDMMSRQYFDSALYAIRRTVHSKNMPNSYPRYTFELEAHKVDSEVIQSLLNSGNLGIFYNKPPENMPNAARIYVTDLMKTRRLFFCSPELVEQMH